MRLLLRRRRQERGAVAVEAALIFPLLILLTFGIIEVSFLLRDYVSLNFLVRDGARTATQLARVDNFDEFTLQAMEASGTALPPDSYQELWIYKVDPNRLASGLPIGAGSFSPGQCTIDCFVYTPQTVIDPATGTEVVEFNRVGGIEWDFNTHVACPFDTDGDGQRETDSIGVFLRAESNSPVAFIFSNPINISDYAVGNFEPLTGYNDDCGLG